MLQDGPPWSLPLHKHFLPEDFIVIPGIVVRLLHTQLGLTVMDTVGHCHLAGVGVHFQQLGCVEKTGVPVRLPLLAQNERRHRPIRGRRILHLSHGHYYIHLLLQLLLQKAFVKHQVGVQRIIVIGKAVRHHFHVLQLGRKAAQRLDQAGVAVDFNVQFGDDTVIGCAVLVEIPVFLAHLFQGVADVKGVFLLLGIQHKRQVVALFDDVHHLTMLGLVFPHQPLLGLGDLPVVVGQLPAQVGQRRVQVHPRKNGHSRHRHHEQRRNNA